MDSLDITLLMFVIRHSEVLDAPSTGWDERPPETDTSVAADLVRIRRVRNSTYAHATSDSLKKGAWLNYITFISTFDKKKQ